MKKIFITGINGQVGSAIANLLINNNYLIIGCGTSNILKFNNNKIIYYKLDITDNIQLNKILNDINPDIIIHCAAWTAVDEAEEKNNKNKVYNINVNGTQNLVNFCKNKNIRFIYISSDYVFEGNGNIPWKINDIKNPINYYGITKSLGEDIVKNSLFQYYIVRTSWIFGINGKNFVKTIIKASTQFQKLKIVNDQIGTPTYTCDLAFFIIQLIQTEKYGIYHFTNWENNQYISWFDFTKEIFNQLEIKNNIISIKSNEYKTKAKRPLNSRLDKNKIIKEGFIKPPHWKIALERYLKEEYGTNKNIV